MACDPFRILRITDGTVSDAGIRNEVDLLSEKSGFCLTEWEPAISMLKRGGVWSDSPISDGRRLRFAKAENVREVMTFEVQDWNADALIIDTQELRRLLEKARAWGTARWQDEEVWIEAQGVGETNLRYAIIADYRTPRDGDPYQQPFWQRVAKAGMSEFQLTLERRPYWLSTEPGTGTATEISAVETYDGRNLGNVDSTGTRDPTTADEVYIANKRNEANLSDLYAFDASVPVFSANLMGAPLPFTFMFAVPAVGDIVYFGIDTTLANSGPFASLVFDILNAVTNITTIVWEYWNGAWVALTVQDNTNADGAMTGVAFDTTGVKSVHWEQPSDWVTVAVNAITGYWVRARVTATPGAATPPAQQNRDIYSIVWPYVEIQETQVGGDAPLLSRLRIRNQSDNDAVAANPLLYSNQVFVGLRSLSRGSSFTAYLNAADEQNPAGITVTALSAAAFINDVTSPTGRAVQYLNVPAVDTILRWTISNVLSPEYYGVFHAFLRARQTGGGGGNLAFQLTWRFGSGINRNAIVTFTGGTAPSIVDMGRVDLTASPQEDTIDQLLFELNAYGDGVVDTIVFDLVLLPVDEWAGEFFGDERLGARGDVGNGLYLRVDSLYPKRAILATTRRQSTDNITFFYASISATETVLQANASQRLWFLQSWGLSANLRAKPEIADSLQVVATQRYISMRGNR